MQCGKFMRVSLVGLKSIHKIASAEIMIHTYFWRVSKNKYYDFAAEYLNINSMGRNHHGGLI